MAFSIGSFAGGVAKGIQDAEDIKTKATARHAQELQIQAAQTALDDAGRAKAVGLAIPQVGAVLPQGYDQQTAMQAAAANYDAKNAADRAEQARSPISRVISALSPHKVALTAASAGVGMPLLPGVPTNGTAPAAPAAPTAVAPTTPLPVGQDTSAAEQITGAAPPAPAAPAAPKPRVQTMEDSWKMLAYQSQLKGDTKGAMEAMEKAGQLHSNGVLKSLRGATPAAMSRVLTEVYGEPRDVVEKDGAYTIRDANGTDLHTYPSFEAMFGDVKAHLDDNPEAGVKMMMTATQDARDQAKAAAEIRNFTATAKKTEEETKYVGPEAEARIGLQKGQTAAAYASAEASRSEAARGAAADKRAQQLFGYQLSAAERADKATKILDDPTNAITNPDQWAWAAQVKEDTVPGVKTSNERVDSQGNVIREQGNRYIDLGNNYMDTFKKDPLVVGKKVRIVPKDGKSVFTYQKADGSWQTAAGPDEALHEAHKVWGGQAPAAPGKGQPAAAAAPAAAPIAPTLEGRNMADATRYVQTHEKAYADAVKLNAQLSGDRSNQGELSGVQHIQRMAARDEIKRYEDAKGFIARGGKPDPAAMAGALPRVR